MCSGKIGALSKQFFSQGARPVLFLINAPALKFRNEQVDDVPIGFRHHYVSQVESVDVRLFHPTLKFVRYCFGRTNSYRSTSSYANKFGDLPNRPVAVRVADRE